MLLWRTITKRTVNHTVKIYFILNTKDILGIFSWNWNFRILHNSWKIINSWCGLYDLFQRKDRTFLEYFHQQKVILPRTITLKRYTKTNYLMRKSTEKSLTQNTWILLIQRIWSKPVVFCVIENNYKRFLGTGFLLECISTSTSGQN